MLQGLREARAKEFEYAAARADSYHRQRSARSMERLFVAPTARWEPEYAALVERNAARTRAFMVEFLGGLDERQRQRAVERLERLAAQFEQLAATGS